MNSSKWQELIRTSAIISCVFIFIFFIAWISGTMKGEIAASWVQAIGVMEGVLLAIFFPEYEKRIEKENRDILSQKTGYLIANKWFSRLNDIETITNRYNNITKERIFIIHAGRDRGHVFEELIQPLYFNQQGFESYPEHEILPLTLKCIETIDKIFGCAKAADATLHQAREKFYSDDIESAASMITSISVKAIKDKITKAKFEIRTYNIGLDTSHRDPETGK